MKKRRCFLWIIACLSFLGILLAWAWLRAPITIHVRIAEDGGFMPDAVKARVEEPLRLRLISDDVEHTFAIGQDSLEPMLLKPGEPVEITLTFDKPGKYTFYTTTPSSLNFWRMRGTIEVDGDGPAPVSETPLYVRLGLDLDDEHESGEEHVELTRRPSASRSAAIETLISDSYLTREYYATHSPMETYAKLHKDPMSESLSEEEVWDIVAFIWYKNTSPAALADGKRLYDVNCAACHGENGAGDGQFADEMKAIAEKIQDDHGIQPPTDFTDPEHLLDAKPAILQGKTLRGGMGTGMPMWGSIFTDEQLWNVIAYLYTFQFDSSN
jgi:plastocyanin